VIKRTLKKANKVFLPQKLYFGPEFIILGVNNVCNLHCKMCDVGTQNLETNFAQNLLGSHPLNMPLELFEKIINQVADLYPRAKIGYAFTEPLVYPHLKVSLSYAAKKGLKTTVTTNALNLKRKAEDLVSGQLSELYISLDGLQETHNYIRGNKQSFQKAIEGIEYISKLEGAPDISVFCVITEWNYLELNKFVDYFSTLPIKKLGFMHQNFVTKELAESHNAIYGSLYQATHSNIEETNFSNIDLLELNEEIKKVKASSHSFEISFSPDLEGTENLNDFYHNPTKKLGRTCNDAFTNVMIKTDGSVIPSHGRCYNSEMGNIYKNTISEIWNSSAYGKFRKTLVNAGGLMPACNRCCSAF
jgi:radical SAM protein with 4Fe4S-binding SPASM domain